jgi:hypothetical protein
MSDTSRSELKLRRKLRSMYMVGSTMLHEAERSCIMVVKRSTQRKSPSGRDCSGTNGEAWCQVLLRRRCGEHPHESPVVEDSEKSQ